MSLLTFNILHRYSSVLLFIYFSNTCNAIKRSHHGNSIIKMKEQTTDLILKSAHRCSTAGVLCYMGDGCTYL